MLWDGKVFDVIQTRGLSIASNVSFKHYGVTDL